MQQLSNLDCFFLAREFDSALAGSFFENFYDFGNGVFRLRFSKDSVLADLRGFAFISETFKEPPKMPSSFAMLLRKHLSSCRLVRVFQPGFERIFEFEFSSAAGKKFLVVELFGKQGNLLLLDSDRKIIAPFKRASYAARSLRQGEDYVLPPSEKKSPLELGESDLEGEGKGKIVSFLSHKTSLAPFYLEEACARAGVPLESKVEALEKSVKKRLVREIHSMLSEKSSPALFSSGGKPLAFSSLEMEKFRGLEREKLGSVSEAVGAYYASASVEGAVERPLNAKLEFQLKSQEEALAEFERKTEELQKAGKWVFENHSLAEELIQNAREKDAAALSGLGRKRGLNAEISGAFLEIGLQE